ncbi:MAG: hypothetical protein DRR19_26440 [Candidatus Parabeggiatoa sp. nov. 1]|nr:MAG: hypothetical protein DRR19_26440 [Gammaproteobacteria bacterium]
MIIQNDSDGNQFQVVINRQEKMVLILDRKDKIPITTRIAYKKGLKHYNDRNWLLRLELKSRLVNWRISTPRTDSIVQRIREINGWAFSHYPK